MWKIYHFLFGWDYVCWKNSADSGVARVHVDYEGRPFYWRYKLTKLIDLIPSPYTPSGAPNENKKRWLDIVWLTCSPTKYFPLVPVMRDEMDQPNE